MNYIFVIRYSEYVDGEYSCGNFDYANRCETEAVKNMLADMENMKSNNNDGIDEVNSSVQMGDNYIESCTLEVKKSGSGITDIYSWWIDKIAIN